jgi:predicted Zn-dependent protease
MRQALKRAAAATVIAALALSSALPAAAQSRRVSLVRDAEAEALIRDYARPILGAAGLGGASVEIKIVSDPTFNAFVADGRHIFVNAGTIMQTETPNELIGVIAHETGHLAGNHLARLREAVLRAQILSALAMLGGVAAAAAGSAAGVSGAASGGTAAALGGAQIGQRSILAYQRTEETSADRAAITYLEQTGQSAKGMVSTFERLADQQLFSSSFSDPYAVSHPMAADRIANIEELARRSPHYDKADDPYLQFRHDLVRAKFVAFTGSADKTRRLYPDSDTSIAAAYARAVVAFRFGDPKSAVARIDKLIAIMPDYAFFHELKGQILLETGNPRAAIAPLRAAVELAPKEGLVRVMLGHALVASDDKSLLDEAVRELTKGIGDDPDQPIGYRQLAIAHARLGNIPMADLATAQGEFASGDIKSAKQYAQRAQAKLKNGSPAWLRADDILTYKPPSG